MMRKMRKLSLVALLMNGVITLHAQSAQDSTLLQEATLSNVVAYALKHQPSLQQSQVDEEVVETTIRGKLAAWYPQLNLNYSLQHNFQVPTNIIGGNPIRLGVSNTSSAQLALTQTIFNRDVLLANRTQEEVRTQARQNTGMNKIEVISAVSKAFYDVLAMMQQIKVSEENISRLENSLKVATSQYKAGVADKTDYKRATILLNNTKATKAANLVALEAKKDYLKSVMGYPEKGELPIVFDSLQMEKEMQLDTLQQPDPTQRIEYKILQTQQKLLSANLQYEKWAYLPSLNLNGGYNFNYQNNEFGKLYSNNFPNSFAALTLSFPILQGGKRKANIQQAEWQLKRNDLEIRKLRNNVNSQYAQALAAYKSNLANWQAVKENLELAKEVYAVIDLQYKSGVKTYLEVITAETDLRTSQINYYNALYFVLSSKIDVEKAMGNIQY